MSEGNLWLVCSYYFNRIVKLLYSLMIFRRHDINIFPATRIGGVKYMNIGCKFGAGKGLWLEAIDSFVTESDLQIFTPQLVIGDNVSIGEYVHIGCVNRVVIGNNVLTGSKVYITDHNHGTYTGNAQSSPDTPPAKRKLTEGKEVVIGDNVWIGEFVTVLPGVHIGAGSIIGSHTTVTHDIPPRCIAVGSPARVIKRWNEEKKSWERV